MKKLSLILFGLSILVCGLGVTFSWVKQVNSSSTPNPERLSRAAISSVRSQLWEHYYRRGTFLEWKAEKSGTELDHLVDVIPLRATGNPAFLFLSRFDSGANWQAAIDANGSVKWYVYRPGDYDLLHAAKTLDEALARLKEDSK